MGRNNPVKLVFLVALATVPMLMLRAMPALREHVIPLTACSLLAIVMLLSWWLDCLGHSLIVTDRRTISRQGLLGKYTNEVLHSHGRNIQISQSVFQRLTHVGSIGISSSGQSGIEIFVRGIPNPYDVKTIIDQYRFGDSTVTNHVSRAREPSRHPMA
jgi:hypothetical protein